MWDAEFQREMLFSGREVIVYCANELIARDFMEVVRMAGVRWANGATPSSDEPSYDDRTYNCYRIFQSDRFVAMRRGSIDGYEDHCYDDAIRCTFVGLMETEIECSSDDELLELYGMAERSASA